ncbi:MAG TPA: site-specific DNA-methyltransferase, partial [Alphaproteobacteria bacterium]|nr:site-specific DNA-methyltransferase [Alphaproteobacteria bacterium]
FIICYQKTSSFIRNLLPRTDKQDKLYKNNDFDGKGLWRTDNLLVKSFSESGVFPIVNPKTGKEFMPSKGSCWRASRETIGKWLAENKIFFGKDGKGAPQLKRYLNEVQQGIVPTTWWTFEEVGHNDAANKELTSIFDEKKIFDTPKPSILIKRILEIATNKNSIILDSFAGSGTTAHAVLDLNKEDGGNRKFILVEMEKYADDITAERVRRVIKGVPTAKDEKLRQGLGGSFTFCKLGDEFNIEKILTGETLPKYEALARYVFYTATGKSLEGLIKQTPDYFIGETDLYQIYLIYKPDIAFLRSNESALNAKMVEAVATKNSKKQKLVFASAKYMGQNELNAHHISFCQLPYAIHKVVGK